MSDSGGENVIDLPRPFAMPSPSDVLANPRQFLHTEQQPGQPAVARVERKLKERPAVPPPAAPADGEEENPGGGPESFEPEGTNYKAFGWAGKKTLPTLRVILKDGSEWPIVYAHLDTNPISGSQFLPRPQGRKGNLIFLRVAGHDGAFMIIIEGVRLRRIWELIMSHQTPWIHELPEGADFVGENDPVIWSITAKAIKPEAGR